MFGTNENKNKHLEAILYTLALNYTGIPSKNIGNYNLQKDLIKSLMDSLQAEVSNNFKEVKNLFLQPNSLSYPAEDEKAKVFSKLNSLLLLDFDNLSQNTILPGNIYEVVENENPIYFNDFYYKENEIKIDEHIDFSTSKKNPSEKEMLDHKNIKRIAIELTPPCDFALRKKQFQSRLVGGIILDDDKKLLVKYFNTEGFYHFIHPVFIKGVDKPQMIIFDFYRFQTIKEDDLKDISKYIIIAKAKEKLFADVLQKLSSHTARLGIAIMYP